MKISEDHLTYVDFFNNEIKTLSFIQGNSQITSFFPAFSNAATIGYNLYKNRKPPKNKRKRTTQYSFNFCGHLNLDIQGKKKKIIVEVMVKPEFSECTYQVIILDDFYNPPTIIRKFHFDFAPNVNPVDKQPIYHLQYGGSATPEMTKLAIDDSNVFPWLSLPRINIVPTNLALLLDLIFCEFKSEKTNKISETPEWRGLIKNNEDLLIKCYYERINRFFSSSHKSNFLFRDFCYGKEL